MVGFVYGSVDTECHCERCQRPLIGLHLHRFRHAAIQERRLMQLLAMVGPYDILGLYDICMETELLRLVISDLVRTSCSGVHVVLELMKDELLGALRMAADLMEDELLRFSAGGCGPH